MVVIDLISSEDEQEVSTSDAPQVVDLGSPCVPMVSIHVFSILAKYQSGCVIHNDKCSRGHTHDIPLTGCSARYDFNRHGQHTHDMSPTSAPYAC